MLVELLNRRFSVRKFKDEPIPQEALNYIIEAGRMSPSGGNEQAWRFGVIDDRDVIAKLSDAAYGQGWIKSSPLLIVLCTDIVGDERGGRDIQVERFPEMKDEILGMNRNLYSKLNCEEHQTKIPGTHMALAALEHGVFSTWVSWFKVEEVSKILGLPGNIIPSEILAFGYPDEEFKRRRKKSREEIIFWNKFNRSDK